MSVHLTAYHLVLAGSVVISLFVAGVGWRYRGVSGARPLVAMLLAAAWWSLAILVGRVMADREIIDLTVRLAYVGITVVPVAWLVFAIKYTGRIRAPSRREIGGLLVVPAAVVVLAWTNDSHHLLWATVEFVDRGTHVVMSSTYGIGFWLWTLYAYGLLTVGAALVLETALFSDRIYRDQSIALCVASVLPWSGNALYITGLTGMVDLTNVGFVLSGVVLTAAIFRRKLLEIVPFARQAAREELVDSMAEAVVAVNDGGKVVDCNPRAAALFDDQNTTVLGASLEDVLAPVADLRAADDDSAHRGEVTITVDGEDRTFDARVTPLDRGYGTVTGHLITLRDVTEQRAREQRIERQRQRLEVVNRVLRHDIRNDMNVILGHAAEIDPGSDDRPHVQKIQQTGREIVELSRKAREIEAITADETDERLTVDAVEVVERAVADVESAYPDAEFDVTCPDRAAARATAMIDSAVGKVIENAVEHNDRAVPTVDVTVEDVAERDVVEIVVADDGPGLPDQEQAVIETGRETALRHSSGLGLWLVYWIVTHSGGEVTFAENEPRGSVITIRLPRVEGSG